MTPEEARGALGVDARASLFEVRRVYRQLLRRYHPDVAGEAGVLETRLIIEAYQTLALESGSARTAPGPQTDNEAGNVAAARDTDNTNDVDTLVFSCPSHEAYAVLLLAAHRVGDVTYVDRDGQLIELLLRTTDGATHSVVISLQGRASAGVTEAFFTVEWMAGSSGGIPPVGQIVDAFADVISAEC